MLTKTGEHQFVEVIKDGKTYIFDNLNPQGITKEEWIKKLEVVDPETKLPVSGEAAYDIATDIEK